MCRGRLIGIIPSGAHEFTFAVGVSQAHSTTRRCYGLCYACFGARRERGSYGLPPSSPIASHSLATVGGECEFPQCVRRLALITRGWSKPLQLSPSHVTGRENPRRTASGILDGILLRSAGVAPGRAVAFALLRAMRPSPPPPSPPPSLPPPSPSPPSPPPSPPCRQATGDSVRAIL